MHKKNAHNTPYDYTKLCHYHNKLSDFVIVNTNGKKTIDFSNSESIFHLNKAILKSDYLLIDWNIPPGHLCPPIPGRADYIHYISDLLDSNDHRTTIRGLDIGTGANCIYPILGSQIYNWEMVGTDINAMAVDLAKKNVRATKRLQKNIEIRHQNNHANIFEGIINQGEYFHFSMCNPPFYSSKEDADKANLKKLNNLKSTDYKTQDIKLPEFNFGGQANELWCNGGESLFIKRMIKQSVQYKTQVGWFTSLVSKKENVPKIYKQLTKLKATYTTIEMSQGQKQSRFIAWKF
ncbi:23S rRNA (adenine(1618)-N(6))-methyltransferase RlmF [Aquimarina sp. RZ0]|uniref:23S rRNA (adenine(1618)-N(6))-methyltransferase RlmF n=1 Tax=Aquimarina sp. RZ0 TaxID=2607730 RepID=UPI0011F12609|nr:23S rRNA (adenine(1618)-N(6))-methyltransferase RlmF [Aquimarina sp. RZ0]KAA1246882.1 23S rRNA (adenine(1618)-N(6))-methyltransferase RlmF [Aquimarina sp. RZ0]